MTALKFYELQATGYHLLKEKFSFIISSRLWKIKEAWRSTELIRNITR